MKVAIASGKGGTGKTTLSTNLAGYISGKTKVVLADLDVEEPNSGLFIKGEIFKSIDKFRMVPEWNNNNCTFCGKCQEVCNFNAIVTLKDKVMVFPKLCHGCYACSELCPADSLPMIKEKMGKLTVIRSDGFDFIESRLDIGQEQAVPLISQTLGYIEEKYSEEYIKLFDSPPGTSCPVIEVANEADFVILVTEPTPFGLNDLKLAVETIRLLEKNFGVVINRSGIGNDDVKDYCNSENIPVVATIPNNRNIAELYSRGELLYNKIPDVKDSMEKIFNYIKSLSTGGNK